MTDYQKDAHPSFDTYLERARKAQAPAMTGAAPTLPHFSLMAAIDDTCGAAEALADRVLVLANRLCGPNAPIQAFEAGANSSTPGDINVAHRKMEDARTTIAAAHKELDRVERELLA